jgi:hypothetical protein
MDFMVFKVVISYCVLFVILVYKVFTVFKIVISYCVLHFNINQYQNNFAIL